ncbi:hypothetical protein [Rhodococcoides yunnanense]|uniref:hypothetical protein n=1 Tax=Rhodococcoides yunnanense TaxID=278209 RepID=UPI0012E104FF|nr:hypothetical protein [Rhodococcus yunnanensis]
MPQRSDRSITRLPRRWRRAAAVLLVAGSVLIVLVGCSASAEDISVPTSAAQESTAQESTAQDSTTPGSTTTPPSGTSTMPPSPALVPPSVIASVESTTLPAENLSAAPLPAPEIDAPGTCVECGAPIVPADPVLPPPSPIDSRGFPLGTNCGTVSCTSPDGLIFVNPDAVPNLRAQPFDLLCGQISCAPPGLQLSPEVLPSTGSAG